MHNLNTVLATPPAYVKKKDLESFWPVPWGTQDNGATG